MLHIIGILIAVGVLMWAVNAIVPLDPNMKKIVNVIAIVCVVLWLLSVFGLFSLPVRP